MVLRLCLGKRKDDRGGHNDANVHEREVNAFLARRPDRGSSSAPLPCNKRAVDRVVERLVQAHVRVVASVTGFVVDHMFQRSLLSLARPKVALFVGSASSSSLCRSLSK